ncbi:MAG: ribosome biogenesis GTP-binding protein YihA/YsxC [Halanaerobiaceae bacterium]
MKVNKVEFITSAYSTEDYPRHNLPEFAFSGRSNVGKSSLINCLVNRKKLARISSSPGRTQSINFYRVNNELCLVDFPGYGFARVPEEVKERWQQLINDYLFNRVNLHGIIQIIDARHKPTADDTMMIDWIRSVGLPAIIAATKVDKLSGNQRKKQENVIKKTLQLKEDDISFTFFSAETGEGKNNISSFILSNKDY